MAQRDVVLRWIEQLGRLVARLLGRGSPGDFAAAREQIDDAVIALLGPLAPLVPRLEPASAAGLLHEPEHIFAYAQLLDLDAAVAQAEGRFAATEETRARAVALAREAIGRAEEERPEWVRWVELRTVASR